MNAPPKKNSKIFLTIPKKQKRRPLENSCPQARPRVREKGTLCCTLRVCLKKQIIFGGLGGSTVVLHELITLFGC